MRTSPARLPAADLTTRADRREAPAADLTTRTDRRAWLRPGNWLVVVIPALAELVVGGYRLGGVAVAG